MLGRLVFAVVMVIGVGLWSGSALAQGAAATGAGNEIRLKADYFSRDPYMSVPQVSPDGKRMAWIEGNRIVVSDLETETDKSLPGGENTLESLEWINNDYLVVYLQSDEVHKNSFVKVLGYSPLVVDKDAKFVRLLFEQDGKKLAAADLKNIVKFIDAPEPYVITIAGNNTYMTEVRTGKTRVGPRLMEGEIYAFDNQGRERMSVEPLDGKVSYGINDVIIRYRATPGGKVQSLRLPKQDNTYYTTFHYGESDNAVYWSEFNYSTGVASIYKYDMASAAKTLYKSGQNKDLDLVFDRSGRIIGLTTVTDRVVTEWTDPYRLKLTSAVQKVFPNATVDIVNMTEDGKDVVLLVSAPEAPDTYYYYNADDKYLDTIGVNYPELIGQPLGEMTYVTYKARDGLEIPAYVTKRKDTPPGAPLIVMPHGGPSARDVYGFDSMAQFLASRGYVVLQPQYRGSSGFGDSFERAGNKHLDLMTTDLEDGVRFLAKQGMINAAKVCVVGWSWGGYLAQASLAFAPDSYVCGVSGSGVSDLFASLEEDNDFYWGGYSAEYWRGVIGRPLMDAAKIRATSPIEHVDKIKAPLLLIHGKSDQVVSPRQSERMNAAMLKAGKKVTYMPIEYMRHGPNDADQRLIVYKAIDKFVAEAFAATAK